MNTTSSEDDPRQDQDHQFDFLVRTALSSGNLQEFQDRLSGTDWLGDLLGPEADMVPPDVRMSFSGHIAEQLWNQIPRPEHGLRTIQEVQQASEAARVDDGIPQLDDFRDTPSDPGSGPEPMPGMEDVFDERDQRVFLLSVLDELSDEELRELAAHKELRFRENVIEECLDRNLTFPARELLLDVLREVELNIRLGSFLEELLLTTLNRKGTGAFASVLEEMYPERKDWKMYFSCALQVLVRSYREHGELPDDTLLTDLLSRREREPLKIVYRGLLVVSNLIDGRLSDATEQAEKAAESVERMPEGSSMEPGDVPVEQSIVSSVSVLPRNLFQFARSEPGCLQRLVKHHYHIEWFQETTFNVFCALFDGGAVDPAEAPLEYELSGEEITLKQPFDHLEDDLQPDRLPPFEEILDRLKDHPSDLLSLFEMASLTMNEGFAHVPWKLVKFGEELVEAAVGDSVDGETHRMLRKNKENAAFLNLLELDMYRALTLNDTGYAYRRARQILRLNPKDETGVRTDALSMAIFEGQHEEAQELIEQYPEDDSPSFLYGAALLQWARGNQHRAKRRMQEAVEAYPDVPKYLLGEKEFSYTPGGIPAASLEQKVSKAEYYAATQGRVWKRIPGAVELLQSV